MVLFTIAEFVGLNLFFPFTFRNFVASSLDLKRYI